MQLACCALLPTSSRALVASFMQSNVLSQGIPRRLAAQHMFSSKAHPVKVAPLQNLRHLAPNCSWQPLCQVQVCRALASCSAGVWFRPGSGLDGSHTACAPRQHHMPDGKVLGSQLPLSYQYQLLPHHQHFSNACKAQAAAPGQPTGERHHESTHSKASLQQGSGVRLKPAPRASARTPSRPPASRPTAAEQPSNAAAVTTVTTARAHCIGEALKLRGIQEVFDRAVLYSARDFCVLSTHIMRHPDLGAPAADTATGRSKAATLVNADEVTLDMPQHACVAVFEFGSAVFFSSFNPYDMPASSAQHTDDRNHHQRQHAPQHEHEAAAAPGSTAGTMRGNGVTSHSHSEGGLGDVATNTAGPLLPVLSEQEAKMQRECIQLLAQFATNPVKNPPHFEEVQLVVSPSLRRSLRRGLNVLEVGKWDRGVVETVSRVMGQSVMLDHYTDIVDDRVEAMELLCADMLVDHDKKSVWGRQIARWWRKRGDSDSLNHEVQLIRSMLLTMKVINRVGIMDKDHTPWESDAHDELWQGLRKYYSVDKRSEALFAKLEQVKDARGNLLQLNKDLVTFRMEVLISILILTEILLSMYTHGFFSATTYPV